MSPPLAFTEGRRFLALLYSSDPHSMDYIKTRDYTRPFGAQRPTRWVIPQLGGGVSSLE